MSVNDMLSGLNDEQLQAVLHDTGNLLILAGAGSGKTRVITTKIAWLIRERRRAPESIIALTFTNKAAGEMKDRAVQLEPESERAQLKTFHSFGAWFLRRNAEAAGLGKNFTIYDAEDSAALARAVFPKLTRQEASRIASRIALAKDMGLGPDSPDLRSVCAQADFAAQFFEYENRLRDTGNVDFGDLITLPYAVLRGNDDIRRRMQARFSVILVDEYQDTNSAQFHLLTAMANPDTYVCAVGDDDQSIYAFRGADINNILSFTETFPNTDIIKLEKNYRSYQSILSIASSVVSHNEKRLGKTLEAVRQGGTKPVVTFLADHNEETAYVVRLIDKHIRAGGAFSDIAVLYRTNAQSLAFERTLPQAGIPIRLVGSQHFYEREEVKDVLALLALVSNQYNEVAFKRIVNKPPRGIGETSVEAISDYARSTGNGFVSSLPSAPVKSKKAADGLRVFTALIGGLTAALSDAAETKLSFVIESAVEKSGLRAFHAEQDAIAGTQKIANIDELINAASDYEASAGGLSEFLESIALDQAMTAKTSDNAHEAVTLITMHNTKGLEFPVVIITGMDQGIFPRDTESDLEEERRLFYVALTRAMDELYMIHAARRLYHGRYTDYMPSIFLSDIPPSCVETIGGSLSSAACGDTLRWKRGASVYHDDFGYGCITRSVPDGAGGVCVLVRFETGKSMQFFPKYTKRLELITDQI